MTVKPVWIRREMVQFFIRIGGKLILSGELQGRANERRR
jgi:hypothetical protein